MTEFEAKAYQKLYRLTDNTLYHVVNKIKNLLEYHSDEPEEILKTMREIADNRKWDYNGIQSKQDTAVIKELEDCLKTDKP